MAKFKLKNKLAIFMFTHKIKQGELAEAVGCSPATISQIINGNTDIRMEMLSNIRLYLCQRTGLVVSMSDILEGSEWTGL